MPDGGKMPATGFIERLRLPACYPHPAEAVELLETHISWVLLAGDFAYKMKKPVSLGFVDFSTLEARRRCCEEELRLNRRTAPDLYLGVVPITGTPLARMATPNSPTCGRVKLPHLNRWRDAAKLRG